MQHAPTPSRARGLAGLAAAAVLAVFGVAAVVSGLDGQSTVRDALALEHVTGQPQMTPVAIAASARKAGLTGVAMPTCSVAGEPIDDGASARCFAEYMRVDALIATGGRTYAQMPRFASKDGIGTNVESEAVKLPNGVGMPNPARNVWITETALSTALNTSYMAERISLFGIAVGAAFLLVGLALGAFAIAGVRVRRSVPAVARSRQPAGSVA
ncbi:MAG: hypothetical protein ACRDMZ_04765 [Solirubrobacteraceae bacterium]